MPLHKTSRSSEWRASRRGAKAVPTLLVASYLVINAADSCQAAPRPVQTADTRDQRGKHQSFFDVDDSVPTWEEGSAIGGEAGGTTWAIAHSGLLDGTRRRPADETTKPTATLSRRSYSIGTASGKSILVPSGFASNIASSWDPGERSIWFQRKAVIICAIFLAIFIVLIIGAAVFLRDKREEDAEEEVDISDEAALKRMREEREMRKGRGDDKRKKRKERRRRETRAGDDAASSKDGNSTTGFVSRWARVPTRKLKRRRTKAASQKSNSTHSGQGGGQQSTAPSPRVSMSANDTAEEGGSNVNVQASTNSDSQPYPHDNSHRDSTGRSGSDSSLRAPLSVTDLTAVEEATEQQQQQEQQRLRNHDGEADVDADAFPPAYIPSHRRTSSTGQVHPSADRQLAAGPVASSSARPNDEKVVPVSTAMAEADPTASHSSMAAGRGSVEQRAQNDGLSAHIATDDKAMLSRLRNAASNPSAPYPSRPAEVSETAPSYNSTSTAPSSSPTIHQASAPALNSSAPDLDVTEEEMEEIRESAAMAKGKGARPNQATSQLLPHPPLPLPASTFSRFDMPYTMDDRSPSTTTLSPSEEKAREAEEEKRRALAVVESRPEDMANLPRYEHQSPPSTPSAPSAPREDEVDEQGSLPSAPPVPAASTAILTSAPPPPPPE